MRRLLPVALLLLLTLSPTAPADAFGERLVLAFYYAWFDNTTWQRPLSDQPAQPYVSTDPAAIERHVVWAQGAGIDGFVQSWYGPQVENNQTETNFALLLDIAARHGFFAAVDFEVTSPFLTSEEAVVDALEHLLNVHARHPAYLRVNGRPVVFFWRQNRFPVEWWERTRELVDPERRSIWIMEGVDLNYLDSFDGTHLYSVAWDADPGATLVRWGERIHDRNASHDAVKYWVATVMPGYDDRVTGRADAFVRDRAGGDYYRNCWDGAIRSGADWVVITSFNEWLEGSQIEPSVAYGDFYLNLTREMADRYRASEPLPPDIPAAPIIVNPTLAAEVAPTAPAVVLAAQASPVPTPTPTVPPTPTSTPIPTPTPTPTSTPAPTVTPFPSPAISPSPRPSLSASSSFRVSASPSVWERIWATSGLWVGGLAVVLVVALFLRGRRR